jgi:ABC-2 type transport system permease protein
MNKNKRKFTIITAVSTAAVIAIATFAVLLCYKIPWKYDMTIQQLFTLSSQSIKTLENLGEDVRIAGVYPTGQEEAMVKSLLDEYQKISDKISVEYVDAEREPMKLADYDLNVSAVTNGTIIVKSGSRGKIIDNASLFEDTGDGSVFNGEREITGAIRYTTSEDMPLVYFVLGHGETDPSSSMLKAVSSLQQEACEVQTLRLTEVSAVPDDADLLVFVSPKTDIPDNELAMLETYSKKGGKVFLMIDSVMNSNDIVLSNLAKFTNTYGIGITNNYVVEENSTNYLSNHPLYLIPRLGSHEITKQIASENKMVILPVVRGLGTIEDYDKTEITNTILLISSDQSWVRADMTVTDTTRTQKDYAGPAPLAYASVKSNVKWNEDASRMVVIGNSSFALDGSIEAQANREFFINSALWLIGDRETDIIASKAINAGAIIIRGDEFTGLAVVCIAVLPGLAFAAAFIVWIIRRNQ